MSKLYHASDIHLSFKADGSVAKPMHERTWAKDSPNYVGYLDKLADFGTNIIKSNDFVVITGDLTHDMKHRDAIHSLRWMRANFNGIIVVCKGNHDRALKFNELRLDTIGSNFYLLDEGEIITIGPYTFGCYSDHRQKTEGTDWSKYEYWAEQIVQQAKEKETIPVMISHYPVPLKVAQKFKDLKAYLSGHVHCTKSSEPTGNVWDWYDAIAKPTDTLTINGCFFSTGTTDILLNIEKQIFREITCLEVGGSSKKTSNQLKEAAAKAFNSPTKFADKFEVEDSFNPGNILAGFICRQKGLMGGSLYITHVNGAEIEPQLIYGTPKLAYPYKDAENNFIDFPGVANFYLANKWNGTNVLFYKYYDSSGNLFITAKTKGTAMLKDSEHGKFLSLTKEALNWNSSASIMLDLPNKLMPMLKDSIQSAVFELCGRKEPHLVKYDFDIALMPLFYTREDGRIEPVILDESYHCKAFDSEFMQKACIQQQTVDFHHNENFRQDNNLTLKYEYEHFATEGRVLYLLDYHNICIGRTLYKVKPKDIEEVHWQSFNATMQGRVNEAVKKLKVNETQISEDSIREELDMGPKEWSKFGKSIKDYLNLGMTVDPNKKMLVLAGLPGSGKTTFAKQLEKLGWIRVNQDELGSRNKCKQLVEKALSNNQKVVIDRCNFDVNQRKAWLDLALKYAAPVDAVVFDTDPITCKDRVVNRKDHPTIAGVEGSQKIVDKFVRTWVPVALEEGFNTITFVSSEDEVNNLLNSFKNE